MHDDELAVDAGLVRALIDSQMPHLAGPVVPLLDSGSDNALFRLGESLLVRLPRQPGGSDVIAKEARWLPVVGPALPVAVPEIVALGRPGCGYPEQWSVLRWRPGARPTAGAGGVGLATDLAAVVSALRSVPVPAEAVADPALRSYRGGPLADRHEETVAAVGDCRALSGLDLDLDAVLRGWEAARHLPGAERAGADRWFHGDLTAENLLVADGRLAAVLDWGGLGVGDPTVDLAVAWELLDPAGRDVFRRAVGADDAEWERGRAWAVTIAVDALPYYWESLPGRCADRVVALHAALDDGF